MNEKEQMADALKKAVEKYQTDKVNIPKLIRKIRLGLVELELAYLEEIRAIAEQMKMRGKIC